MKIIINVMLLLLTEKKRENILSRLARFNRGKTVGKGARHNSRIECIKIINYEIHARNAERPRIAAA